MADKVIFTGKVDEFFDYKLGKLEYRTVRFETETLNMANYQGNAVVNYTAAEVPYTNNRAQAFRIWNPAQDGHLANIRQNGQRAANLSTPSTTSAMETFTPSIRNLPTNN